MAINSLVLDFLNKGLNCTQKKSSFLWQNSIFLKNIDNIIFATILLTLGLSTFASSDLIGYIALTTLFLTVIKLFIKPEEKLELKPFDVFLLVYFLLVVISLAGSSLLYLSLKGFFKTFTYLGFYFSAVHYFKDNKAKIPYTIGLIALCATLQGVVGIFQNFSQVGEISTWQDVSNINPEDVMTRVYGTLQPFNPNLFGGYLTACIPAILGLLAFSITEKKYKYSILFSTFALTTSVALVLSGCRGAYIGLFTILVCYFALIAKFIWQSGKEKLKKVFVTVVSAGAALACSAALLISSIRTRIFSIFAMRQDSSTSFRLNVYQSAIDMVKDNWLLGIGIGNQNFREIYGLYMKTGFDALSAYSVFLELAVESGIFASLAFLGFVIAFVYCCAKYIFSNSDIKKTIIISTSMIAVIAVMVHGLVDTVFFRPQIQFAFWTMVALAAVEV